MEILVVLFLLSSMDNNGEFSQKLRSMLNFYRENRDLIAMFQSATKGADSSAFTNSNTNTNANEEAAEEPAQKNESRPCEEKVDSMKIIEEYLKRSSV